MLVEVCSWMTPSAFLLVVIAEYIVKIQTADCILPQKNDYQNAKLDFHLTSC